MDPAARSRPDGERPIEATHRAELGGDASGLARLGTERRLQGAYDEAAELYRRALALDPGELEARQGMALLLCLEGNADAAAQQLRALVAKHPDSVPLRAALGDVLSELGEYRAALECYEHVLDGHPEHAGSRLGLAYCLSRRPLLALRLRSPRHVAESLTADEVDPDLLGGAAAALLRASPSPLEDPLLPALLHETVVTDLQLERLLTQVRRELCLAPPAEAPELAAALAAQCRLNEAAWAVDLEEEARLAATGGGAAGGGAAEGAPETAAAEAAAPAWVRAMYAPAAPDPELAERAARIPALTPVSAGTSAAVAELYEAAPYPLWRRLSRGARPGLPQHLRLLTGGTWEPPDSLRRPRLLVAGCGTGRELLGAAWAWRPAAVTGFDLSRSSLARAQQAAERLGIEVELFQADLLELGGWEREFDAVVCTGVLHHLDDPLAGWRILLRLLRPGGVMLAGLYSETARRSIAAAQAEVLAMGVEPAPAGIRAARARLAALPPDHPAAGCAALRDFYCLSGCRDLLFHVREHRFTLPQVAAALEKLGLTFLAFETDGAVRRLHRKLFGTETSLACWDRLEELYPDTFLGMYQFWCLKES